MKKQQSNCRDRRFFCLKKTYLAMKLTLFFVLFSLFQVSASVYSQTQRLTIKLNNASIKEALNEIEEKSDVKFLYKDKSIEDKQISIDVQDVPLDEILNAILKTTGNSYQIMDNNLIIISPDDSLQHHVDLTGKVTNGNGEPIPGVTVIIKGTTQGTIADTDGNYSLSNVPSDATLVFSFVGMKTQEIKMAGKSTINITMEEKTVGIEEVVAIGYGTMKKSDLTGTVSNVSTQKTEDIPNTSILQSLQGSVAGLNITTPDRPGENPSFTIRGLNSISVSNTPLIVVDGIIYNGSLNDFNVNDIESVDILKDASAAAVYGSRSSNGVIIITTKMGKTTKPTFDFSAYYGVSTPVKLIPLLDGAGYIQKILDYRTAVGLESDPDNIEDYLSITEAENYKNGKTIDWYDKLIKPGITQSYNLNVSGKNDKTNYFLSGTYYIQEGIVENDNFERITLKANFTNHITDWYTVSLRTSFSSRDYSGEAAALSYGISPYGSYWENESQREYKEYPMEDTFYIHPMLYTRVDNKDIRTSLLGTFSSELEVPFIKGLKWTFNYSHNLRDKKVYNFWDNTLQIGDGATLNGRAKKEIYDNHDWTLDNIISYKRTFLDAHSVDVTLLYSREQIKYESTIAEANDFFNQALGYNNLGLGGTQSTDSDYEDENSVAYMARLNYIYKYRYSFTATVRKDGFSGFSEKNKYAVFPSAAFAWTVSNEKFMENISWLDMLKFRISYGKNGNQALGRYQTLAIIENDNYVFDDESATSIYTESMANTDLSWETTKVKNIGVDFSIFKNKLNGSIDMYSSNTYDVLLERDIPVTSGYSTVWTNIGKVHNKGIEIALNYTPMDESNLKWECGFTFSLNRNRIDELLGEDTDGDGKEDDNVANAWFIGEPLKVKYSYKTDGIYQLDDDIPSGFSAGDFRLVDKDGNGSIDTDDRMILGSTLPNYSFSISNTLQYKNFSLYVLINSIQGGGKDNYYIGNNIDMHNVNDPFSTWTERFNFQDVPYWTPGNPSNEYSSITYNPTYSHPYIEDRSFVKIQDVTLSYSFDRSFLNRLDPIKDLRLYVSGKNLYTWTKWTGYDPENATAIGDFPMLRTITLGVDLKF